MPEELIAIPILLIIFGSIFGPQLLRAWSEHKRRILELEIEKKQLDLESRQLGSPSLAKGGRVSGDVSAQLEALRREVAALRDTSTNFDMSLDANLQNLQQRIAFLENRIQELEQQPTRRS